MLIIALCSGNTGADGEKRGCTTIKMQNIMDNAAHPQIFTSTIISRDFTQNVKRKQWIVFRGMLLHLEPLSVMTQN